MIGNIFHRVGNVVEVYHSPELVIRRKNVIEQVVFALIALVTGIVFWPTFVALLHDTKVIMISVAAVLLIWLGYPYFHMLNYQLTVGLLEHGIVYDGPEPEKEKIMRIAFVAVIAGGLAIIALTGLIAYFS